jgi:hypothetical protein
MHQQHAPSDTQHEGRPKPHAARTGVPSGFNAMIAARIST